MQTRKKCVHCNTLNEPEQIYCISCGRYLKGKISQPEARVTIWGIDNSLGKNASADNSPRQKSNINNNQTVKHKYIVVCPDCGYKVAAEDGIMPLSCSGCGYFFQVGIDKIIDEADQSVTKNTMGTIQKTDQTISNHIGQTKMQQFSSGGNKNGRGNPLKRATADTSSLRLTSVSSNNILPVMMKESGNIIGKNGNVFKNLRTSQQLSIWHTITGWYARAIMGEPLYNGVPMNQGIQVKLSVGDLLILDQEQFMVEIFE